MSGHERNRASEAHSLAGDGRGRHLSGHGKKPTERGPLTCWGRQKEKFVRRQKETNRASDIGTHKLENTEGRPSQYMETMCESGKRVAIEASAWDVG